MTQIEIQALLANGVEPAILVKAIHDTAWHTDEARIWRNAEEQVANAQAANEDNPL